jgi:hypothetical protein
MSSMLSRRSLKRQRPNRGWRRLTLAHVRELHEHGLITGYFPVLVSARIVALMAWAGLTASGECKIVKNCGLPSGTSRHQA